MGEGNSTRLRESRGCFSPLEVAVGPGGPAARGPALPTTQLPCFTSRGVRPRCGSRRFRWDKHTTRLDVHKTASPLLWRPDDPYRSGRRKTPPSAAALKTQLDARRSAAAAEPPRGGWACALGPTAPGKSNRSMPRVSPGPAARTATAQPHADLAPARQARREKPRFRELDETGSNLKLLVRPENGLTVTFLN